MSIVTRVRKGPGGSAKSLICKKSGDLAVNLLRYKGLCVCYMESVVLLATQFMLFWNPCGKGAPLLTVPFTPKQPF